MMIPQPSILVSLLLLVDRIPMPPSAKPKRGHPTFYPDRLFLKAVIVIVVRRLHKVHEFLSVLDQPEMERVRSLLTHGGEFPSRRTWERRLNAIPEALSAQIVCLGYLLVKELQPWRHTGPAVVLDSTVLRAHGGVWHQKDRAAGIVPHTAIDTEAHWTKSGWHGWVYGWKLHLIGVVSSVWIPLAAKLTPANVADKKAALELLPMVPKEARFVLGDLHYNDPDVRGVCEGTGRFLVTTRRGKYPHTDGGVDVRRIFHRLRSQAIENFNGHFKSIFHLNGQVPTKGLRNTQRVALGAVFVYQIALLYRAAESSNPCVGLKAFLRAA